MSHTQLSKYDEKLVNNNCRSCESETGPLTEEGVRQLQKINKQQHTTRQLKEVPEHHDILAKPLTAAETVTETKSRLMVCQMLQLLQFAVCTPFIARIYAVGARTVQ